MTLASCLLWLVSSLSLLSCQKEEIRTEEMNSSAIGRIMIVPDIQHYTDNASNLHYLDAIAEYYVGHSNDFSACIQVGDITNNNVTWQWENAYQHFFSKYPVGNEPYFCLGNHDYGENGKSGTRTSNIPQYMKPIMDFQMGGCDFENYVRYLWIGTTKYAVLDLEFAPRNEALEWANSVVSSDSTTPFIILTHVFLNRYAQMYDATDSNCFSKGSQKSYIMDGDYLNDSKEIFDKFIYNHPNIKLIICGHSLTPNYIDVVDMTNVAGERVYCLMVNYQHYTDGGLGYVGILDFKENGYRIRSFSSTSQTFGTKDIEFGNV